MHNTKIIFFLLPFICAFTFGMDSKQRAYDQNKIKELHQTLESDYGNLLKNSSNTAQLRFVLLPDALENKLKEQIKKVSDQYTFCYYGIAQFKTYVPLYRAIKRTLQKITGTQNKTNFDELYAPFITHQKNHYIIYNDLYPNIIHAINCLKVNDPHIAKSLVLIQQFLAHVTKNKCNVDSCISLFKNQFTELFEVLLTVHESRPLAAHVVHRVLVVLGDIIETANKQQWLTFQQKQKFIQLFSTIENNLDDYEKSLINNLKA